MPNDEKGTYFLKYAGEKLDFVIDWSVELGTDTISSSSWSVPTGITQATPAPSNTATTTTIWISGGTAGSEYTLTNTIVTAATRTYTRELRIKVVPPADATTNLITLDYLKSVMGRSDSDPDSDTENGLLLSLIEAASDQIKDICGREFFKTTYTKKLDLYYNRHSGYFSARLPETPVVALYGITSELVDGIKLTNAATNKVLAQAWVKGGHLYLNVIGGTQAGLTDLDLSLAANDTLSELISVISGGSKGWTASLATGSTGYEPSSDLAELPPISVPTAGEYLQVLDDADFDLLHDVDYDTGILSLNCLFNNDVWAKYQGGYDTIPAELQLLAARWALMLYDGSKTDPALVSERIGDYSYTRESSAGNPAMLNALQLQLKSWKANQL